MKAIPNFLKPESRFVHAEARGAALSHLIGLCFFLSILLGPALLSNIIYVNPFDWPIRIVGLWLIIDRVGKRRHTKLAAWDWAHLFLLAGYGCALIYAELFMIRDTGLMNYVGWMNVTLNGYLYFVVTREGLTRRGFKPHVLIRWFLFTLVVACGLALLQSRDLGGARHLIDGFYHQAEIEQHMEGPSEAWQARAPTTHANSLAMLLLCGLPLLLALSDLKKFRWFDWGVGLLIVVTSILTYSRIGIISLASIGLALIAVWSYRREYAKAAAAIFSLVACVVLFAAVVVAFDISRFKVLVEKQNPVSGFGSQDTSGWKARQLSLQRSIVRAERYPFTGLKAASSALNQETVLVVNPYTYQGLLLNVYVYCFVSYGFIGLAYLAAILWLTVSQIRNARGRLAFASTAFVLGIAMMVFGIAENVVFYDGAMYSVNIVMAMCVMGVAKPEEETSSQRLPVRQAA